MVPDSFLTPLRSYMKGKFDQFKDLTPLPEVPSTYMYKYAPSIGTPWKRVDTVLKLIETEFDSLGEFLSYLFHNRDYGIPDPRTPKHCSVVASFLHGQSNVNMGVIIDLIYQHRAGQPSTSSHERASAFSSTISPHDIANARTSLSAWATQLIGQQAYREICVLTRDDPNDPADVTQLCASTNGRAKNVQVVTWDHLGKFTIGGLADRFAKRAPLVFYLTEAMAAPRKNGVVKLRIKCPHPMVSAVQDTSPTDNYIRIITDSGWRNCVIYY